MFPTRDMRTSPDYHDSHAPNQTSKPSPAPFNSTSDPDAGANFERRTVHVASSTPVLSNYFTIGIPNHAQRYQRVTPSVVPAAGYYPHTRSQLPLIGAPTGTPTMSHHAQFKPAPINENTHPALWPSAQTLPAFLSPPQGSIAPVSSRERPRPCHNSNLTPSQKYEKIRRAKTACLKNKVDKVLQQLPQDQRPNIPGFTMEESESGIWRGPTICEVYDGAAALLEHIIQLYLNAIQG